MDNVFEKYLHLRIVNNATKDAHRQFNSKESLIICMRLVRQMDRRTSPRKQPATTPRKQLALASSDDDISEVEKTAKTWGKKKASPTKKKAKTTAKTSVREDSDDDYSSEDDDSLDGMKSLEKKKGTPQKKTTQMNKKKRSLSSSEDDESHGHDDEDPTEEIYDMTRGELIAKIKEQEKKIRDLKIKLQNRKDTGRRSLKDIRLDQDWNAEETLFSDVVGRTVKSVLFPRYKFLKIGWEEYRPNVKDSLSSMMEEAMKMKQPQTNKRAMWEKVTVYTIRLKYTNMKCNINNVIKTAYKGKCCIYMQRDYFAKLNILHITI